MGIDTPLEMGHTLQTAVQDFMGAYATAFELAYGLTGRGDDAGGRSSGTSDRTGEAAAAGKGHPRDLARSQLKKAGKKARTALKTLAIGEAALGALFHEISGRISEDDPPPISVTSNRFRGPDDLEPWEVEEAKAARDKRQSGVTTVIAADRFGVV